MKEEFRELYDYIIHSNDEEKMHVLGQVTKDMMCKFIDNHPQQAREYLDMLQSVKWNNYLTAKESDAIITEMLPKPLWNRTTWDSVMASMSYPTNEEPYYNDNALYVTMCMITSDSGNTLTTFLNSNGIQSKDAMFKLVYSLALDKLKDKDGFFCIRSYFGI